MSVPASDASKPPGRGSAGSSIGEVIDTIKAYAQQQTIGPLKNVGRWLAYGAAASFTLSIGLLIMLLGLLRLIQAEWERSATGALSWLAYVITLVVTVILLAIVLSRIKKATLDKEPK
jgi:cytochrome c biogenesis protein CcdA